MEKPVKWDKTRKRTAIWIHSKQSKEPLLPAPSSPIDCRQCEAARGATSPETKRSTYRERSNKKKLPGSPANENETDWNAPRQSDER